MLPKVATHLLHTTSRAVVAVQNQTHTTIRNVLSPGPSTSLGPWGGSSNSGSNNGPSSGGQKYTGSRFYSGYSDAGRAVTQANAITSQDGSVLQTDDSDEVPSTRPSSHAPRSNRPRSSSLTTPSSPELGVLKTVQLHARSRHAFAGRAVDEPALVRRNSTANLEERNAVEHSPPPPSPSRPRTPHVAPAEPASPPESPATIAIRKARSTGDPGQVAQAVRDLVDHSKSPSLREYNLALVSLRETRRPGEPLVLLMQTYNAMLKHGLIPNLRTYFELITAITDRDHEIFTTLTGLETRVSRGSATPSDHRHIAQLRAENTFDSAMKLFKTVNTSDGMSKIPLYLYVALLRSCANHQNKDAALHVLGALESRSDLKPVASVFRHMIRVFTNVEDLDGTNAEMIFDEFVERSAQGDIDWVTAYDDANGPRRQHLQVYNQMIEAHFRMGAPDRAVELLEKMMSSSAPAAFGPADVPRPASSTYTAIIAGFVQSGDLDTAVAWFERLLTQTERPRSPYEAAETVLRPDAVAWACILDALAFAGRTQQLNRMFLALVQCAPKDSLRVRDADRELVHLANMQHFAELTDAEAAETTDFLVHHVLGRLDQTAARRPLWQNLVARGMLQKAIDVAADIPGATVPGIEHPLAALATEIYRRHTTVPYTIARQLVRLAQERHVAVEPAQAVRVLQAYADANDVPAADMDIQDWTFLLNAAVEQEIVASHRPSDYTFRGLVALLEDMSAVGVSLTDVPARVIRQIKKTIFVKYGTDELYALFNRLGPSFASVLDPSEQAPPTLASAAEPEAESPMETNMEVEAELPAQEVHINKMLNKSIEETLMRPSSSLTSTLDAAYGAFRDGLMRQQVPTAFTIGKLIQGLGRQGMLDRVRDVYSAAQLLLQSLESNKQAQSSSWFAIENSMIIALAHAGDLEAAHIHRMRILEMHGAPTADAYGALILYVKDTTDDTSNALALFHEAQVHRVVPNQYLYNNIISKLAKARKADYALELFEQMKAGGVAKPSSITYGAVIGACARVGDVHAAENLFAEMVASPGYRARIPPFNTMMQLYTTTKPNRERALFFYNQLRSANIAPTAYTYKLLMDAYGRLDPVDIPTMEQIWQALQDDPAVELQGNHFATLINAYGCVQGDLDKALSVFRSIPTFPGAPPRDALVFEAMINTFVAHRRTDLMPEYIALMHSEGVHMTAYIANFLIKGYADVGDMNSARSIFEGLVDPPSGIAAFNNHAPHEPATSPIIDPREPVYREPSTWEVMVRAELGSGNRDNALALLERLKARGYPTAVENRISGILIDHSMVLS
ncbi:hypothetical protein FB45DRAFT_1001907 [Roridomyces roridus]|uniref:PROP1-like PPR domain-containing protein n=1 Tax=Roridomyces roridus TaxID=1738132 RepID=A0AAD7FTH3_9AGAR|nr:hypothetical protein FB45DRAFT_1001907 [Roridomyces roridus]